MSHNKQPNPTEQNALVRLDEANKFKGYTLNELRYQRAVVALQREFAKQKAFSKLDHLKKRNPFSASYSPNSSGVRKATSVLASLAGKLNYLDYAVLGFSLFKTARKALGIFRGKKK